jgi:hypothetical protein
MNSKNATPHVCQRPDYCYCNSQALEPDEKCPIHGGGEWPPRCMFCGQFMQASSHATEERR